MTPIRVIDPDEDYSSRSVRSPVLSEEFLKLQSYWYARIAVETDFIDIEDSKHSHRPLKSWHNLRFRTANQTVRENRQEYFNDAKDLLSTYSFKTPTHRLIWSLHVEGLSKRKIERYLSLKQKIMHESGVVTKALKREQIGNIVKIIAAEIKL